MGHGQPQKNKLHVRRVKIPHTSFIQTSGSSWTFQWNLMPCVTQVRIPTAKAPTQKVAASKEGGERLLAFSEGRDNLTRREMEIGALQIEDFNRGIIDIWCTHTDQQSHVNSRSKIAADKRVASIAGVQKKKLILKLLFT